MTIQEARRVLAQLHDGVHPVTGECLPDDGVWNEPDVLRALHKAIIVLGGAQDDMDPPPKPSAKRPWCDSEIAQIKHMFWEGMSLERMARILQRRKRGVERELVRLGLAEGEQVREKTAVPGLERHGMPWTVEEDERLRELYDSDAPLAEIGKALRRTQYAIECRLEKQRLFSKREGDGYPPEPLFTAEDLERMREMGEKGQTYAQIARALGKREEAVRGRLFYMGLSREAPFRLRKDPNAE